MTGKARGKEEEDNEFNTALPSRYFGTHRQCFAAANLTWPTYVNGRKRENCFV